MDPAIQELLDRAEHNESGSTPPISNHDELLSENDQGKSKIIKIPRMMPNIIAEIKSRTDNWPRRIDNMMFVDDAEHGLSYFDRHKSAGLFGWLRQHHTVRWTGGGNFVSQAELFAEYERTATSYDAIELYPHEPPIKGVYYRHDEPTPGDGTHLGQLLDRFRPETPTDRDLILAAFLTAFWGGQPGRRPAFVITSHDGRGVGKSTIAELIGYLCGGHMDISAGENITNLKARLLTPTARELRIALLDNVKTTRFSWAELEALVTTSVISGKQMYVGEGQRPNLLTWFITINGAALATDMAQRSVIIKIVRGTNEGAWWEQTIKFIDDHREHIIGDIIGMLRLRKELPTNFRFSRWATWEQHVLSRLPDPLEAQRLILERQGEVDTEFEEADLIEERFSHRLAQLEYNPDMVRLRIPVHTAATWYCEALGRKDATAAASRRLHQMIDEGQLKRLARDKTRRYGRSVIWTGNLIDAASEIDNGLPNRMEENPHLAFRQ